MNKFLLIIIGVLILLGLIGITTTVNESLTVNADKYILGAEIIAVIMMLVNGTFISTVWFRVALFFLGLTVLDFIFRIMHLSGGDGLSTLPLAVVFVLYAVHFFWKNPKRRVDALKLLTVLSSVILPPIVLLRLVPVSDRDTFFIVNQVLLWSTFLDVLYTGRKDRILSR